VAEPVRAPLPDVVVRVDRKQYDGAVKKIFEPGQEPPWNERPLHPITGLPCDGFWEWSTGRKMPYWKASHWKRAKDKLDWIYTTPEIARALNVSVWCVGNWCRQGKFPGAIHIGAENGRGARWRIPGRSFKAFLERYTKVVQIPEPVRPPK